MSRPVCNVCALACFILELNAWQLKHRAVRPPFYSEGWRIDGSTGNEDIPVVFSLWDWKSATGREDSVRHLVPSSVAKQKQALHYIIYFNPTLQAQWRHQILQANFSFSASTPFIGQGREVLHPLDWPMRCLTRQRMLSAGEDFFKKLLSLATGVSCKCITNPEAASEVSSLVCTGGVAGTCLPRSFQEPQPPPPHTHNLKNKQTFFCLQYVCMNYAIQNIYVKIYLHLK